MAIIKLRKGDDFALRASFTSEGVPYDMSGWEIESSLRYANCTPTPLATAWTDQPTGIAGISLTEIETMLLTVGEYELQIRATSPEGVSTSTAPSIVRVRD